MIGSALLFASGYATAIIVWGLFRKHPRITVDDDGHWSFPVDTLAQMLAIPAERRERFLAELPNTLRHLWAMKDKYPLATLPGAVWVDDGLGELRPNVMNAPAGAGDAFAARKIDEAPQ